MSSVSRNRMGRGNSNRNLRNLVTVFSNIRAPKSKTSAERVSAMSKRISHGKPSYFSGKGGTDFSGGLVEEV